MYYLFKYLIKPWLQFIFLLFKYSIILPYANEITLSVHAEETAETAQDVIKSFNRLNQEEKSNFISKFPKVLSEFELTKLTYEIGKNQNEFILKDCDCISKHYTSREILQALSPVEWLSKETKFYLTS